MEDIKLSDDGKVLLPQPHEISEKNRDDAMGAYLMMFASWGLGLPLPLLNLLASVIYYFINKKESRFVAFHSLQSLLTQIPVSLLNAILLFWIIISFFTLSFFNMHLSFNQPFYIFMIFVIVWNIIYIVYSLIACVKAKKGKFFYMIVFGRICYQIFYGKNAVTKTTKIEVNAPPDGF